MSAALALGGPREPAGGNQSRICEDRGCYSYPLFQIGSRFGYLHSRYTLVDDGTGVGVTVLGRMGGIQWVESAVVALSADNDGELRPIRRLSIFGVEPLERLEHPGQLLVQDCVILALSIR